MLRLTDWLADLALWLFIVGGYWCWRWRWWLLAGLLIAITAGVGTLIYFRLLAAGILALGHSPAVRRLMVTGSSVRVVLLVATLVWWT
jgi:hypothetical protein